MWWRAHRDTCAVASRWAVHGSRGGSHAWPEFSLNLLAHVGTHDATNSFKAYSRAFVERAGIDSDAGFELGIELVAKARRLGLPVAELPTIWLDRADGTSNFKVKAWIPRYLHWYLYALGVGRNDSASRRSGGGS